jgi:hypothetical protein
MTSPEDDDDLEQALRRALSGAADKVEPGADGLDKIHARIDGRPPRPWLLSVVFGVLDRVRNWTWHGHWAWQESLPRPGALWRRRSRRSNFPRWDIKWLRLVTALAGVAVLAGIALGVQPVRDAILQASTSLNGGGGGPTRGGGGTEGDGTQTSGGNGAPTASGAAPGGGQPSQGSTATVTGKSQSATPHSVSTARCVATALPVVTAAEPSPTSVVPGASGTTPATKVTSPATSSPTQPNYTATDVPTCPVGSPTSSPTPTPTSSPSSPAPTPADVSETPVTAPSNSDPSQDPAPAPTPTPAPTASTRSPTAGPARNYPSDPSSSRGAGRDARHAQLDVWRAHRR